MSFETDATTFNLVPSLRYKTRDMGSFRRFVQVGIGLSCQSVDVDGGESYEPYNPGIALTTGPGKERFEIALKYMKSLKGVEEAYINYFALTHDIKSNLTHQPYSFPWPLWSMAANLKGGVTYETKSFIYFSFFLYLRYSTFYDPLRVWQWGRFIIAFR